MVSDFLRWTHKYIHKNNGKCFGGKERGTIRENDARPVKRQTMRRVGENSRQHVWRPQSKK